VKAALDAKARAYDQNADLVRQYGDLVAQSEQRTRLWYIYTRSRLNLTLALRWVTTDPAERQGAGTTVDQVAKTILGDEIVKEVNQIRLKDLKEHGIFLAGAEKNDMTKVIQDMPRLSRLCLEKAKSDFEMTMQSAPDPTESYMKYLGDLGVLRQLNAAEKSYLDIDVTVKGEDVKEIADAIRKLQGAK
jgi:hypothetical protein